MSVLKLNLFSRSSKRKRERERNERSKSQAFLRDFRTVLSLSKIALKSGQRPCTIVQGKSPKITRKEFSIFIIFSDTYTCTYVV